MVSLLVTNDSDDKFNPEQSILYSFHVIAQTQPPPPQQKAQPQHAMQQNKLAGPPPLARLKVRPGRVRFVFVRLTSSFHEGDPWLAQPHVRELRFAGTRSCGS